MDNIDFLVEILTTENEYWLVAQKCEANEYGRMKRVDDQIWIICIPYTVKRGLKKSEILLTQIESLRTLEVPNICVSEDFPPFQHGISMRSIYKGLPIDWKMGGTKKLLIELLKLGSKDIYQYEVLLKHSPLP